MVSDEAERLVALARTDLARRLGTDAAMVELVSAEPQEWADASLGCPEPGRVYAQVITRGYRITLASGGRRFRYHSDNKRVKLCERAK